MKSLPIDAIMTTLLGQKHTFQNTALMDIQSEYKTPFHVLISCILSLRTKDEVTGPASQRLFALADTPKGLLGLDLKVIEQAIYPAGFYKTKARTIHKICKILLEQYNGQVPTTHEQLLQLPGVGPKTAAITMVYGHNQHDHIPTDTHVHRISNRLGWVKTKLPEDTEIALKLVVPKHYWKDLNDMFVQFGQNICKPISPWCSKCPVAHYCPKIGVKKSR
ncbi:endonuclease III [Candidatus Woesearchaeota archaeon]|nr:endonuclease III [Candidatus Woesearchaeota archaeon]